MHFVRVRRSRWGRICLLGFVLSAAGSASAGPGQLESVTTPASSPEGASPAVLELTWPDVVRLAETHPRLAADRLQVEAARRDVDATGAIPNPTFEAGLGRGRARAGDDSRNESELALSIPFGWIAQRGSKLEAAGAEVDVAVAEGRSSRRDVLLRLRTLFWNLAYEQARVAVLETLEAQTSKLALTVKRRVETGEVRPVEGPLVEIELEKVTSDLEAARTLLLARQAALARWLAVPRGGRLAAAADLGALPVVMDLEGALARARAADPGLMIASARARALTADVKTERRAPIPSFSLRGFATDELDRQAWGVGIAIDIPVWNWNSGRVAQARAKLAAGSRHVEAAALELETTVIEAQAACSASVATATRFRDDIVPRSETVASTMERTYQLGEASLLPVIDARRTLLDSRRLCLAALAQAQLDCSRLGALAGEELQ
ncbi:MAG: TolC family protein [Holophagales bacterium]|nr:TolC family protein [Holophagales bacterium]